MKEKIMIIDKQGKLFGKINIIDLFIVDEEHPIRIEFFGDEIESIRYFNVDDQKSISKIDNIKINPIFEMNFLIFI